ncbi:hypothetical protein HRbin40_00298 [bacterium HR40]|nr:hypothetical protein HRbin40_00298 [bacterium HR40]
MVDIGKRIPRRRRKPSVGGHYLPPPRPTGWAVAIVLLGFGLPVVGVLAVLDLLLYLLFTRVFGLCYGLSCFFG